MAWEVNIIQFLQGMSNPFLDGLFLLITQMGDDLFFIIIAALLYWCFDTKFAFKFMNVYFMGSILNEGLKYLIVRQRPYFANADKVSSIGPKTEGYSFPSGHSQSIANISTQMTFSAKPRREKFFIVGIVATVLVMFSRMYLGQHFLTDVIVGCIIGILCAIVFSRLYDLLGDNEHKLMFVVVPCCIAAVIVLLIIGKTAVYTNILKVTGGYSAVTIGYYFQKKYINYNPRNSKFIKQIIKLVIGLTIALLLKEGLKFILPKSIPLLYDFLRYFLVAAWASIGSIAVFKAFKL